MSAPVAAPAIEAAIVHESLTSMRVEVLLIACIMMAFMARDTGLSSVTERTDAIHPTSMRNVQRKMAMYGRTLRAVAQGTQASGDPRTGTHGPSRGSASR